MTLHLVRRRAEPVLVEGDTVVDLDTLTVQDRGTQRPITHEQLIELIVAATRVITW